ncbi:DUF4476 domain-containing protein [Hyalangium sp.]|uniref:DUF4476 domain-containing protein n=1 Tax=Hyalangium sp. TaxID=2028555 RepID=UPI002D61868E|nr:DUF4476 domain-containing protein [Hyalangium sp.]HYI01157.1 DUF4476 domain-containing protein [Hyalangium sp.]
MKQILRAALVSSLFASSAALAQDVEMNMNIQVDEDGNPTSANIQMRAEDENGEVQGANVRVRGSSTSTTTRVKVRGGVQTEEHYTETTGSEPTHMRRRPPPPSSEPAFRDCGTGRDPGCTAMRDGNYAMDADTWRGFYQALKSQHNEITREEMAEKMLKRNYLTAAQLGLLLDLFQNEITRLDVAKFSAPHVVNPQHALGFSSKWQNSISAGEYTELISEQ